MRAAFARASTMLLLLAAPSPGASAGHPEPTRPQSCLVRPGWWLGSDGQRLFRVIETGTSIEPGALPATACGVVQLQATGITGSPCLVRSEAPCASQVEIFFVTSQLALLSARLIHDGTSACSDTCMAWDAAPAHPDTTVGVSAREWSGLKTIYR